MPIDISIHVRLNDVRPGATYEGETFDQYVDVTMPDGSVLELFDMAPMIGQGLSSGSEVAVLLAVDTFEGFGRGGSEGTVVATDSLTLVGNEVPHVRSDVVDRNWALLTYRGRAPMLLAADRLGEIRQGTPVTWGEAVFTLIGWGPAGERS